MQLKLQFFGGRGASSASSGGGGSNADGVPFKKGNEIAPEDAVMNTNAHNYNSDYYYKVNCQRCVWAYEMQRRGYDVEALPSHKGDDLPKNGNWMNISEKPVDRVYIAARTWEGQKNSVKTEVSNATETMAGWGEGSRGIVRIAYSANYGGGGHVFNVEYKNGKITAYEAQTGKIVDLKTKLAGTRRGYTQLIRSDNVTFKTSEVSRYVKERGKK